MSSGLREGNSENWLKQLGRKFKRKDRKLCLILNICSTHGSILNKSTHLKFLPPDTTEKLHACNQGLIECIKAYYRREMLLQAISSFYEGTTFFFNLLVALSIHRIAWKNRSQDIIPIFFFKKLDFF